MRAIKLITITVVLFSLYLPVSAQILNTDNLGRGNDTTRVLNGTWDITGNASRVTSTIVNVKNKGLLNFYMDKQEVIFSTTFNMLYKGDEMLLNGGHGHVRYRKLTQGKTTPEAYFQVQWDGARGMQHRYLLGQNLKFDVLDDSTTKVYAGFGFMYENERWNYDGVDLDPLFVPGAPFIENEFIKMNLFISLKKQFKNKSLFSLVSYLQTRPDSYYKYPRIAGDASFRIPFSDKISYVISYNWVYDSRPVVPINKMYYRLNNGLKMVF